MKEKFEKIVTWLKDNKLVAALAGFILLFFIFKKLKGRTYKRRRRTITTPLRRAPKRSRSKSFNRVIKSGSHRGKKAWQIKGSPEARRRMAALRRMRTRKLL